MKYREYLNHCLETWGEGNDEIRIKIGIEEEFGELAGKVKRWYRGDYKEHSSMPEIAFQNDLKAEIGDCLYYVTMAHKYFSDDHDFDIVDTEWLSNEMFDPYKCWTELMQSKRAFTLRLKYKDLAESLCVFANKMGLSIEDVIQYNIDKLMARKAKGTIKGTGDDR